MEEKGSVLSDLRWSIENWAQLNNERLLDPPHKWIETVITVMLSVDRALLARFLRLQAMTFAESKDFSTISLISEVEAKSHRPSLARTRFAVIFSAAATQFAVVPPPPRSRREIVGSAMNPFFLKEKSPNPLETSSLPSILFRLT